MGWFGQIQATLGILSALDICYSEMTNPKHMSSARNFTKERVQEFVFAFLKVFLNTIYVTNQICLQGSPLKNANISRGGTH